MPVPPYAQMQVALGGGAPASGYLQAAAAQSVLMSGVNTTGWTSALWEIYDAPPGLTLPAGWSSSPGGLYQYAPTNPTTAPPSWTTPAVGAQNWGKFMLRLRVNGNPLQRNADGSFNPAFNSQLTDEATVLWVPSPTTGAPGIGYNEGAQGDALRGFVGPLMVTLRDHETALASSGGWVNKFIDHDCTADANATISNGANTIGGLSYTASNVGNSNTFAVVNGTGWQIQPKATCDYDGATATAPCLRLLLSAAAIPNLSWSTKLRLWLYFDDTVDADAYPSYEATVIGIDGGYLSSTTKAFSRVAFRGVGTGPTKGIALKNSVSGGSQTAQTLDLYGNALFGSTHFAAVGSNNVLVCETLGFAEGSRALFGTYASGWPSDAILNPALSYHEGSSSGYADAANINVGSLAAANLGPGGLISIIFAAPNNGGNAAYMTTLKRWRLDYRN